MSKFIKLSRHIINTKYIHSINIIPEKYYINMINDLGKNYLKNYKIEISKTNNPCDYEKITEWIEDNEDIYDN
jgi:hypothetical protein